MNAKKRTAKLRTAVRGAIAEWLDGTEAAQRYARAERTPRPKDNTRKHLLVLVAAVTLVALLVSEC